jgi:hypothetical protein
MTHTARFLAVLLAVSFFVADIAQAQMILLGRKAVGKVRQLTSETTSGQQSGYDAATVLLEARADKVYSTAVDLLQANKDYRITRKDDRARTVEFTDGKRIAGIQISPLEDHLCQLLIVSTGTSATAETTSLVLNAVLRVCKEMGVQCEPARE